MSHRLAFLFALIVSVTTACAEDNGAARERIAFGSCNSD
jgi:hypothetical protein